MKTKSAFNTPEVSARLRANIKSNEWAARQSDEIVGKADYWYKMDDEDLWGLMFGPELKRSWHVWSDGFCPVCKEAVPMYNWKMDAKKNPWKVMCPHCKELFPKNDFYAYYKSGLDEKKEFRRGLADEALLYNTEHPDAADPLRMFCVDDGNGCVDGGHKRRFIAAYLVYGQWKDLVLNGIKALADAYGTTGIVAYGRKALILLDRVADMFPRFDFMEQGVIYELEPADYTGFVSYSIDSCPELGTMAESYDWVYEAAHDPGLIAFLSKKAAEVGAVNTKSAAGLIRGNIENNILRAGLDNPQKLSSNFPANDIVLIVTRYILNDYENEDRLFDSIAEVTRRATEVDGLTGEKGLSGYAAWPIGFLASLLQKLSQTDGRIIKRMLERVPRLSKSFIFHLNTLCLGKYYPLVGDEGYFAHPIGFYAGIRFNRSPGLGPSMFSFFYTLYKSTGDPRYIQIMVLGNGAEQDMPYDMFCDNPKGFLEEVNKVLSRHGTEPKLESVNYGEWHIALLRAGEGSSKRAAWISYDTMGKGLHGHMDGMNLGLYAYGLDLMPDFGYAPVQYGGWYSDTATWYLKSAAHNTALIDKKDHRWGGAGRTILWHAGEKMRAAVIDGSDIAQAPRFERSVIMLPAAYDGFYIVDIFRITGGVRHDLFFHSHFASLSIPGLDFCVEEDFGEGTLMRNTRAADAPAEKEWIADFDIRDEYGLLMPDENIHVRYHGLTSEAKVLTTEGWINAGMFDTAKDKWIPRIIQRRNGGKEPLKSCFVSVIEPFEATPQIRSIKRHELVSGNGCPGDSDVCLEVTLTGGRRDILISSGVQGNQLLSLPAEGIEFNGKLALLQIGDKGVEYTETVGGEIKSV